MPPVWLLCAATEAVSVLFARDEAHAIGVAERQRAHGLTLPRNQTTDPGLRTAGIRAEIVTVMPPALVEPDTVMLLPQRKRAGC